jgi:hypothetical protein
MYKDVLRDIAGIDILPAIMLIIFLLFFTVWIWQVFVLDKSMIDKMGNLPLDNAKTPENEIL